jgi:hypothetical protein
MAQQSAATTMMTIEAASAITTALKPEMASGAATTHPATHFTTPDACFMVKHFSGLGQVVHVARMGHE